MEEGPGIKQTGVIINSLLFREVSSFVRTALFYIEIQNNPLNYCSTVEVPIDMSNKKRLGAIDLQGV